MKKIDEGVNTIIVKRAYAKRANLGSPHLPLLFVCSRTHAHHERDCMRVQQLDQENALSSLEVTAA